MSSINATFNPLVYFWIAFYNDGTFVSQFNFETGTENHFIDLDLSRIVKFGLLPFGKDLAFKANLSAGFVIARVEETLPYFMLKIESPKQRLIYVRRNYINHRTYQVCGKCGYIWQWMPNHVEGMGQVELPIHQDHIIQKFNEKLFHIAVCPKCKSCNYILCPTCETLINEIKNVEEHKFICPKCNVEYPRFISISGDELRQTIYLLGYQTNDDKGRNKKQIIYIYPDGTFEISDDYDLR